MRQGPRAGGASCRYWNIRENRESDLVMEVDGGVWGVEVKAAASVNSNDGKGLRRLAETVGKNFRGGLVFYNGLAVLPIDRESNVFAMPLSKLWEL